MPMTNRLIWKGKQLTARAEIGVSLALESFAVNVWSEARRICPIDTGSLRNSIRIEKLSSGGVKKYVAYRIVAGMEKGGSFSGSGIRSSIGGSSRGVGVGIKKGITNVRKGGGLNLQGIGKGSSWRVPSYALYVELGTSRMAAQPFLRPSFNKFRYRFKKTIRKYMRQKIR